MPSLEQRVSRLELAAEARDALPPMFWWTGDRDSALEDYLAQHGREPDREMEISWLPPDEKVLSLGD